MPETSTWRGSGYRMFDEHGHVHGKYEGRHGDLVAGLVKSYGGKHVIGSAGQLHFSVPANKAKEFRRQMKVRKHNFTELTGHTGTMAEHLQFDEQENYHVSDEQAEALVHSALRNETSQYEEEDLSHLPPELHGISG